MDGGGVSPQFITILHRGLFKVYYNITDLVGLWKGFDHFQYYICFYVVLKGRILSQIWEKFQICQFREVPFRLFQYYIWGNFSIYYNIIIGGEGSTRTPNLYYVINGRPLMKFRKTWIHCHFLSVFPHVFSMWAGIQKIKINIKFPFFCNNCNFCKCSCRSCSNNNKLGVAKSKSNKLSV